METENKHNTINFEPYLHKINGYLFTFMANSITGKLNKLDGNYIIVETKSGSIISAHVDTVRSIWNIHQKSGVV